MVVGSYNNPLVGCQLAVAFGNCGNSFGDYPVVVVGNYNDSLDSCCPAVAIGNCDNSHGDADHFDSLQDDHSHRGMDAANDSHYPGYLGNHYYYVYFDQIDLYVDQLVFVIYVLDPHHELLLEVDSPDRNQDSPLLSWQLGWQTPSRRVDNRLG